MLGHYIRVQEAASLLGVTPPTIRWHSAQGFLPTHWIGRGQTGHRRFLYADVVKLGNHLGRSVPPEEVWDTDSPWNLKSIATYLGLSDKFLIGTGLVASGIEMTWDELQELERTIYGSDANQTEEESGAIMGKDALMDNPKEHGHHGHFQGPPHHMGGHGRGPGHFGPWGQRMMWQHAVADSTDLLVLKSAKRHLEAQKADLEDQIAVLVRKIESHPDYEG